MTVATTMHRTPGKARGLRRISDDQGRFAVLALDQRPPFLNFATQLHGKPESDVTETVTHMKALVAETLTGDVSGLLVDPMYGYCAAVPVLPSATGLLLTVEDHRWETTAEGFRRSHLIAGWGVEEAVRSRAEAIKLLVWYRPDAPADVRRHQEDVVRRVGAECREHDIALVLELLVYRLPDEDEEPYRRSVPDLVKGSVEAFVDPDYGVDLYKLELPGNAAGVRDWGGSLYDLDDLEALMKGFSEALPAPWVLLSAGMPSENFVEAMGRAARAGAHGFMAGRSIYWQAMQAFPDGDAVRSELESAGRATLRELVAAIGPGPLPRVETDCAPKADYWA